MSKYTNRTSQSGFKLPKEVVGLLILLFIAGIYWLYQNIVWFVVFIVGSVILTIGFTIVFYNKFFKILSIVFIVFLSMLEFLLIGDYTYYNTSFQKGMLSGGKELFIGYVNLISPKKFFKKEIKNSFIQNDNEGLKQILSGASINN